MSVSINGHEIFYTEKDRIGDGNSGKVYRAKMKGLSIALKVIYADDEADIRREIGLLCQLNHENIVKIFGYDFPNENMGVVAMELLYSSLLHFVRASSPHKTLKNLLGYAKDIAKGMEYLVLNRIVHRDLAARNILITNDLKTAKITDFGLSQFTTKDDYYNPKHPNRSLPARWYAPEVLDLSSEGKFSHASDVWSYGVTLFEIFSLGKDPYEELIEAKYKKSDFYIYLKDGNRLEKPKLCPDFVYEKLMSPCWTFAPGDRITFTQILTTFCDDKFDDLENNPYVNMNKVSNLS